MQAFLIAPVDADGSATGNEMKHMFSPRMRVNTWRQLWIWLLEAQKELGLPVTDEALNQMKLNKNVKEEEFAIAAKEEAKRR